MDKFVIRTNISLVQESNESARKVEDDGQKIEQVELSSLIADPGLRISISQYHPNIRDQVRRVYLQKGPCQPNNHNFKKRKIGDSIRRFCPTWYGDHESWLEYSVEKEAVFCLCCYLFKNDVGRQGSGDSFVKEGFDGWNKKDRLDKHVGGTNSAHKRALKKCEDLMRQDQHIDVTFNRHSRQVRKEYRIRLGASIDCVRFLLRQGLALRGHDESDKSPNQGNFLELLKFLGVHNIEIDAVVGKNAPSNLKVTSPDIQHDIINASAVETVNNIIHDLGDDLFAILIDESRDISVKEQMIIILRYVDKNGCVLERFIGIEHVPSTSSVSLKLSIDSVFATHGLSISRIRGQGYDGASNMRGEFNGLKSLILRENESAHYIHCFAHQLQLTLVAIAKNDIHVGSLFNMLAILVNVVGASCKRRDMLRERQVAHISEALANGELISGHGLNQETTVKRAGDTRWGSHYGTLVSVISMFESIVDVLDFIVEDGLNSEQRDEASNLLELIQSFDFIFSLYLMKVILGITNELSIALQRKEQDIVNAMQLVKLSKHRIQILRDEGWDDLLSEVCVFCEKHSIIFPSMDENFQMKGRSRRKVHQVTNLYHYKIEFFYVVLDLQLQELNNRFSESSMELLICVSCLSPNNSFSAFDKEKLIRLAQFYPNDFSSVELTILENQLSTYILDMRSSSEFSMLNGISALAEKLILTKKSIVYHLVYLLVKLALILPVSTASVEKGFSAMKIVKNRLRNRMGDQLLNDSLVTYVEKTVFDGVVNEAIMQRFQNMKNRRGQL